MTRRHLAEAAERYKDAKTEIAAWVTIVKAARWTSFNDLRTTFADADVVDGYVVFNIRHNRYRLVTVVHFAKPGTQGHIYIRSVLSPQGMQYPGQLGQALRPVGRK